MRRGRNQFERAPKAPDPETEIPVDAGHVDVNAGIKPGTMPLGELLLWARTRKGLTRAQLATLAEKEGLKVGASSIVRWEKAGTDDPDGQYPPAHKLAILCFVLGLRPSNALISSLPEDLRQEGYAALADPVGHPMHDFMKSQYLELLHEMQIYRTLFGALFGKKPEKNTPEYRRLLWLIGAAKELFKKQTEFENQMSEDTRFVPMARQSQSMFGPESIVEDWVYKGCPEIALADGDEVAELLGWEKGEFSFEKTFDPHVLRVQAEKYRENKMDPEEDLAVPSESDPKPTPNANKEKEGG